MNGTLGRNGSLYSLSAYPTIYFGHAEPSMHISDLGTMFVLSWLGLLLAVGL